MTKKFILLFSFFTIILTTSKINAQSYKTGIGFRLGGISSGISVKHFMGSTAALEGILSFGSHYAMLTGLYEKHNGSPKDHRSGMQQNKFLLKKQAIKTINK